MKTLVIAFAVAALVVGGPAIAHEEKTATTIEKKDMKKPTSETASSNPKPSDHSGGTDANGCHTNHSTGAYHCHNPK